MKLTFKKLWPILLALPLISTAPLAAQDAETLASGFDQIITNTLWAQTGDGTVLLTAVKDGNGGEIYRTDGTSAGTFVLGDFSTDRPAGFSITETHGTLLNGGAVITLGGTKLTDGTIAGTVDVPELRSGGEVAFGYYFSIANNGNLSAYDGSNPPVDLGPISEPSRFFRNELVDNKYFYERDGGIWVTDGTQAGTQFFGTPTWTFGVMGRTAFLNDSIYSFAPNGDLYRLGSDGEVEVVDTQPVFSGNGSNIQVGRLNDKLIYQIGRDIYVSDGTVGGASMLVEDGFLMRRRISNTTDEYAVVNGLAYIQTASNENGLSQFWVTDGTTDGTYPVSDEASYTAPFGVQYTSSGIAFTFDDGFHGSELWVVSPLGTFRQTDLSQTVETDAFVELSTIGVPQLFNDVAYVGQLNIEYDAVASEVLVNSQSLVKVENLNYTEMPVDFVISEDAEIGAVVGLASQTHTDSSTNYTILDGDESGVFSIDPITGKISVSSLLDFETNSEYVLEVSFDRPSFNDGGPPRVTVGFLRIEVLDEAEEILPEVIIPEVIEDIQDLIESADLNQGQGNPIQNFLSQALNFINKGKTDQAIGKLNDAIDRVQDLIDNGGLSQAEGDALIEQVELVFQTL